MPADKSKPSQPQSKPESIRDLPQKKGSAQKDEQVKGGRAVDGAQPHL